jgi:hypothetical protein
VDPLLHSEIPDHGRVSRVVPTPATLVTTCFPENVDAGNHVSLIMIEDERGMLSKYPVCMKIRIKPQHWQRTLTRVFNNIPGRDERAEKPRREIPRKIQNRVKSKINIETRRSSTLEKRVILVQGPC